MRFFCFSDYKSLVNGQMLNPEEIDFVEDPTVFIDGVPQEDEMNQPAEDPAPYGENLNKVTNSLINLLLHWLFTCFVLEIE